MGSLPKWGDSEGFCSFILEKKPVTLRIAGFQAPQSLLSNSAQEARG